MKLGLMSKYFPNHPQLFANAVGSKFDNNRTALGSRKAAANARE
jgi:hypothetical protein